MTPSRTLLPTPRHPAPVVAAVEMGYGHLRAGYALAEHLGSELVRADQPPVASSREARGWTLLRETYEALSRASYRPVLGAPARALLDQVTAIPHLQPPRDLSRPTGAVRAVERLLAMGLGRGLRETLREAGGPLVTPYLLTALAAAGAGAEPVFCVVTDADLARAWVSRHPATAPIHYLVPSQRAARRLRAYGVPEHRVTCTGFPLPHGLLGGPQLPTLRRHLAARLARLDPSGRFRESLSHGGLGPEDASLSLAAIPDEAASDPVGRRPHLVFAVGGAGAQVGMARTLLQSLRPLLEAERLRLTLVAGTRRDAAERFSTWVQREGLEDPRGERVGVLHETAVADYFRRFHELLADADVLWTKPSELTFFAALGLPLLLAPPVGVQERYNRRWVLERGAALRPRSLVEACHWLEEWLHEGVLAAAAWAGYQHLPKTGLYRILEAVSGAPVTSLAAG